MLPKDFSKRPLEYVLLFVILLLSTFTFMFFSYTPRAQRRVIYMTCAAYMFWSLLHHYNRGDLSLPILLEYLIIALFASVLITTTLVF